MDHPIMERWRRRLAALAAAATIVAGTAGAGRAATIRADRSDFTYRDLANQPQFAAVGDTYFSGEFASFTLIAPNWALTAAHCADANLNGSLGDDDPNDHLFIVGGQSSRADALFVPGNWTGNINDGYDIALARLSTPITSVTPATLYTGFQELGQTITEVGYGQGGTGLTGAVGSAGTKRAGNNVIDRFHNFGNGATGLLFDFDEPSPRVSPNRWGSSIPLDLESQIAPGDSGGGSFIFDDGEWYLAGVHSGTYDYYQYPGASSASGNRSTYGDASIDTRVSAYQDFITSTMLNNAVSTAIPEPTSLTLLMLGALAATRRRRSLRCP